MISSLIKQRPELYSDFRRDFIVNPVSKDLARKTNEDAVTEALQNIILIDAGEVPFKMNFGCGIRRYLFESITPETLILIKDRIQYAIRAFEPRVEISGVNVIAGPDDHSVHIVIYYYISNKETVSQFEMTVKRLR